MLGRGRLTGWALVTCLVTLLGGPLAAASPGAAAADPLDGEEAALEAARLSITDVARGAPGDVQLDVVAPLTVAFRSVPATAFDVRSAAGPQVIERADRVEPAALAVAMVLDVAARDAVRTAVLGAAGQLALLLDPATAVGLVDRGPPTGTVVPVVSGGTDGVRAALAAANEAKATLDRPAAVGLPGQSDLDPLAAAEPLLAGETARQRWVVAFAPAPIAAVAGGDATAATSSRGVSVSVWRADAAHPQPVWQAVVEVDDVVTLVPLVWNRLANRYRLHLAPADDDADQLQVDLHFEDVSASATAALPERPAASGGSAASTSATGGARPATTLPAGSVSVPGDSPPAPAPPSDPGPPWAPVAAAVGGCLLVTALVVGLGLRRAARLTEPGRSRLGRPPPAAGAPEPPITAPDGEVDDQLRAAAAQLAGRLRAGLVPDTAQVPDRPPPAPRGPAARPWKRVVSGPDPEPSPTDRALPVGPRVPADHQQVGQTDSGRSVPG